MKPDKDKTQKLCLRAGLTPISDIDRQAQERFERLIKGMKQAQGITEHLKEENALEWAGWLNNIRACAREIIEQELIFV